MSAFGTTTDDLLTPYDHLRPSTVKARKTQPRVAARLPPYFSAAARQMLVCDPPHDKCYRGSFAQRRQDDYERDSQVLGDYAAALSSGGQEGSRCVAGGGGSTPVLGAGRMARGRRRLGVVRDTLIPARSSSNSSISTNCIRSRRAAFRPTALLPVPINPVSTRFFLAIILPFGADRGSHRRDAEAQSTQSSQRLFCCFWVFDTSGVGEREGPYASIAHGACRG